MPLAPSKRTGHLGPTIVRKLFDARKPTAINLGLGEPANPVPYELLDAGVARFREKRTGYTLNAGMLDLRERILAWHAFPHIKQTKNVIVTVGAQGATFATLMAIADPGDEIIVMDPSFWSYRVVAEMLGLTVRAVPLVRERGFAIDVDAIAAAIGPRTKAVFLNSPSNPTGRVDSESDLRALVAATEKSGVWIVSDEVYREIYYGDAPPPSVASLTDRAIVVSSLSKTCSMTGFRLGWVLAPDSIATAIAAVNQYNVTSTATIAQYVALEAFTNTEWLSTNRPRFVRQRAAMMAALDRELGVPYHPTEGGFFVFADMSSLGMGSLALAERILTEADVVTVPGIAFGPNGEGFLRISFAESEENIAEGVRRIAAFVKTARG